MYPLKFEPILKQTLWGGDKIIPFKHLNDTLANVGESWEVSAVEGMPSAASLFHRAGFCGGKHAARGI